MGNRAILVIACTPLNSLGNTPAVQQKPTGLSVSNGVNSGVIDLALLQAEGAKMLMYQHAPDPITVDSVWASKGTKNKKFKIAGLTPGSKEWFRVVSIGNNSVEMISDPVSIFVN
jgi:hypothetical protein